MAERKLINLTVTMTKEERNALKQMALDHDMATSEFIRKWLAEKLEKEVKSKNGAKRS